MEGQYLSHMMDLMNNGERTGNRTDTDTVSIFGHQMKHDMRYGFPLLTTKKVFTRGIIHELLWLLSGDTNIKYLLDNDVHIWDEWADENGDLGPVYGKQWRSWPSVAFDDEIQDGEVLEISTQHYADRYDQISNVIDTLKTNPDCRRILVSAWNVGQLDEMALQPCHTLFQFKSIEVNGQRYLDLQLYQRSTDWFLGVPFNIASYALLLMMVAQQVDMIPRRFIHTFGDTHLYVNHLEQAKEQTSRIPSLLPLMSIKKADDIFSYTIDDFTLMFYEPHPAIKGEVAI